MFSISDVIHNVIEIGTGFNFLFFVFTVAFTFKIGIVINLLLNTKSQQKAKLQLSLLLLAIMGAILVNFTWILKTAHKTFLPSLDQRILMFCIRITWAIITLHYHALAVFIESLLKGKNVLQNVRQKILIPISSVLFLFFICLAFVQFNTPMQRPLIELWVIKLAPYYFLFALLLVSLFVSLVKLRSSEIPRILKKQFNILVKVLFFPIVLTEFIHFYPIKSLYVGRRYTITAVSLTLLTYALYHCMKKIIGLRFLNLKSHVQSQDKLYFVNYFKTILEKFSYITNTRELVHITKSFFKEAFSIPIGKTHLYIIRPNNKENQEEEMVTLTPDESTVEAFLSTQDEASRVKKFLMKHKIVINDELAFSNFYKEEQTSTKIVTFLNHLNADIFIPIYENHKMIAYIIVERFARISTGNKHHEFYSSMERDQMIIFANYLGNIINPLKTKNLNHIIKKEKDLHDRLHSKEKEITQYKESIRSFLKNNNAKNIGIFSYKNRIFTPINQAAQTFVPINLNTHSGHPISKAIKKIASQVIKYKSPQKCFIKNISSEKLVVSGILNIEKNNVIITVRHPEIADILQDKISILKDPKNWEYLLYLETTEYGKIINTFIPSNSENFLNFKIELLKGALHNQAILLNIPEDDIMPVVEILHHMSQRETLEILEVKKHYKNFYIPIKLFGVNPIFGIANKDIPLLEKLNKTGTLLIKNVEFIDPETQDYILDYIKYGRYKTFKGYNREKSDVRIILSASQELHSYMQENKNAQTFLGELRKNQITLPPIHELPEEEILDFAYNIAKQAIKTDEFHHILELTETDKKRIIKSKPISISNLKNKVQQILVKKSQKQSIYDETQFDPAYNLTDPQIIEAARLGKHALRDPKIMGLLWGKLKSQNKIANLLGVNRSSVNRRCKEYNLI